MRPVVVHLHVPKTAGVSVGTALAEAVAPHRVLHSYPGGMDPKFLALRNAERDARWDVLIGHDWLWGAHRWFDRPVLYVSALRHPVARVVSHFNFIHTRPGNGRHATFRAEFRDLNEITRTQMQRLAPIWSNFAAALYQGRTGALDATGYAALERRIADEIAAGTFLLGEAATVGEALRGRGLIAAPLPNLHATPSADDGGFTRASVDTLSARAKGLIEEFNRFDLALWQRFGARSVP